MNCPSCKAALSHVNGQGEPMLRNAGIVFKDGQTVAVCPKCKSDVPFTADAARTIQRRMVLILQPVPKPP